MIISNDSTKEDLLGYEPLAKKIQQFIQRSSGNSEPLIIGIYGKWGEKKYFY